ncbi:unnamed protein product [Absidia cylindrospora]
MLIKTEPSSDDHCAASPSTSEQASTATLKQPQHEDSKKEEDPSTAATSSFTATPVQVPMSMPLQDDLCLNAMEATIQSVFDALNVLSQQQQQQETHQQQEQQRQPQLQRQQGQMSTASSSSPVTVANVDVSQTGPYPVVTSQPMTQIPDLSPAEQLKQQMVKQKIRDENRTRKQRWRVNNEERNKDNDLRCRVNKRSHKLFGMEPSEHKKKWVAEEFQRRRAKRQEKERRKQAVNGALAATHSPTTQMTDDSESAAIAQLQHKLLQHYQSLFGMDQQDSEKTKNSTAALVAALQNPQLLQLSQLLAQTVTTTGPVSPTHPLSHPHTSSMTPSSAAAGDPSAPFIALPHHSQQPLITPRDDNKDDNRMELDQSKIDLAAAEIMKQFTSQALTGAAHHLDQTASDTPSTTTSTTTTIPTTVSETHAVSSSPSSSTNPSPIVSDPVTAITTVSASATSTTILTTTPVEPMVKIETEDTPMEEVENNDTKKDQGTEKKNDYPMDAVMTLMELNAGWRP